MLDHVVASLVSPCHESRPSLPLSLSRLGAFRPRGICRLVVVSVVLSQVRDGLYEPAAECVCVARVGGVKAELVRQRISAHPCLDATTRAVASNKCEAAE